jgi:hypothetical protein
MQLLFFQFTTLKFSKILGLINKANFHGKGMIGHKS